MTNDATPASSMHEADAESNHEELELPLVGLPLLGELAVLAALVDLLLNRFWLRAARGVSHATLVRVSEWGALPRNLAAVAGLVALLATLLAFLRSRAYLPIVLRVGVAGLAGIFLPTVVLATVLPAAQVTGQTVIFATATANLLVVFLSIAAIRWQLPVALRLALLTLATTGLLGLFVLLADLLALMQVGSTSLTIGRLGRHAGELCWLATAPLVGLSLPRRRGLIVGGVLGAIGVTLMVLALKRNLGPDFAPIFYGGLRLELLLGNGVSFLYAPLLGLTAGVAIAALLSPVVGDRQLGAALLLLAAGAYAPRAPGLLLMMVLGAALFWRGAVARASLHAVRRALVVRD